MESRRGLEAKGEDCLVDMNAEVAEQASQALAEQGVDSEVVLGDVGDDETAQQAVRQAIDRWGRIDILVNNAGVAGHSASVWELPLEEMDRVYRTNLRGCSRSATTSFRT